MELLRVFLADKTSAQVDVEKRYAGKLGDVNQSLRL